ncbi:hypothetical protein ACFFF7_02155 [Novosphingobium aquiterrae]|uniref:Uncharacterized protein n=1 Tax=Novosphingobium aquiterrae TaxID=624388 RepID=A0ABV6PEH6_9SPHN
MPGLNLARRALLHGTLATATADAGGGTQARRPDRRAGIHSHLGNTPGRPIDEPAWRNFLEQVEGMGLAILGTRWRRMSPANIGPNRFHQCHTVSWHRSSQRSYSRSSTFRSDRGNHTYIITTRRITSGEELK